MSRVDKYINAKGKSLEQIFARYDFDGSGHINSVEEAQQITTNIIYLIKEAMKMQGARCLPRGRR